MMITTFTPLGDRILARRLDPETRSEGGLLLDEHYATKNRKAVVVAVGPGKPRAKVRKIQGPKGPVTYRTPIGTRRPMTIVPGQVVWLPKYVSTITVRGVEHVIVHEADIYGVFDVEDGTP